MSNDTKQLHSHSSLERELKLQKQFVLVDKCFQEKFLDVNTSELEFNNVKYIKVPTLAFFKKGGVFKNFLK